RLDEIELNSKYTIENLWILEAVGCQHIYLSSPPHYRIRLCVPNKNVNIVEGVQRMLRTANIEKVFIFLPVIHRQHRAIYKMLNESSISSITFRNEDMNVTDEMLLDCVKNHNVVEIPRRFGISKITEVALHSIYKDLLSGGIPLNRLTVDLSSPTVGRFFERLQITFTRSNIMSKRPIEVFKDERRGFNIFEGRMRILMRMQMPRVRNLTLEIFPSQEDCDKEKNSEGWERVAVEIV
ncbi:hypothetical protein PFISCL1PPCAC_18981, partial [Pristionchus fissidentatus]